MSVFQYDISTIDFTFSVAFKIVISADTTNNTHNRSLELRFAFDTAEFYKLSLNWQQLISMIVEYVIDPRSHAFFVAIKCREQ